MSCNRLSASALAEQDRWLSYNGKTATREERLEFLRYDSHGGEEPTFNPILEGKAVATSTMCFMLPIPELSLKSLRQTRGTSDWPGGIYVIDYWINRPDFTALIRLFGESDVRQWVEAWATVVPEDEVIVARVRQRSMWTG